MDNRIKLVGSACERYIWISA